ncbi:hypothetical protein PR003_g26412 [Phytophthora rubi]|uniref:Uncharacterized protein n=1 Tax=Phytophthora rubi TaxID=129364 RepID=A0A6A4C893_9STRA|nr:hypothetical protein PR003_g26412 [Phytophthora rubi]
MLRQHLCKMLNLRLFNLLYTSLPESGAGKHVVTPAEGTVDGYVTKYGGVLCLLYSTCIRSAI